MLFKVVSFLWGITMTFSCNCRFENWDWKACNLAESTFRGVLHKPIISEGCHYLLANASKGINFDLSITSIASTIDGTVHDGFYITFSDPFVCSQKERNSDEDDEFSFLYDAARQFCGDLQYNDSISIQYELQEEDMQVFESLVGDFNLTIRTSNINNDRSQTDCYHVTGSYLCDTDY